MGRQESSADYRQLGQGLHAEEEKSMLAEVNAILVCVACSGPQRVPGVPVQEWSGQSQELVLQEVSGINSCCINVRTRGLRCSNKPPGPVWPLRRARGQTVPRTSRPQVSFDPGSPRFFTVLWPVLPAPCGAHLVLTRASLVLTKGLLGSDTGLPVVPGEMEVSLGQSV